MKEIKVMVNGLPGNMSTKAAEHIVKTPGFTLIPYSFTGPEITQKTCSVEDVKIELITPENKEKGIDKIIKEYEPFITSEFIRIPKDQVGKSIGNIDFYIKHNLPFITGTVGLDIDAVESRIKKSNIVGLAAPNMAIQIVAFQNFMTNIAMKYEGKVKTGEFYALESHQESKGEETSGTMKAIVPNFQKIGVQYSLDDIIKIRKWDEQRELGVPETAKQGHGWHVYILYTPQENFVTYKIAEEISDYFLALDKNKVFFDYDLFDYPPKDSEVITNLKFVEQKIGKPKLFRNISIESYRVAKDDTVSFSVLYDPLNLVAITHNVNGRDIYAKGNLNGIQFLHEKITKGKKGKLYRMTDAIKSP